MRINATSYCRSFIVGLAILAAPLSCLAELGGNPESIHADQLHMKGSLRVSAQPSYTVHEIQTATGTLVREYVTPAGVVFAVAWRGRAVPDLKQLFGPYFTQYVELAKTQHTTRGPLSIADPQLVVHSSGHMRAFFGRAYLPQMLPPDVTVDDIR